MVFDEVFQPFIEKSPVSVMFRGTLENTLSPERLDRLFERTAQKQVCGELTFSCCAKLLSLVVTKIQPSVNASYRTYREEVAVSVQAVYQKLAGVRVAAEGTPAQVLTRARIAEHFDADVHVVTAPDGSLALLPARRTNGP
jgi:hypothetical protein